MANIKQAILITGATGKQGGALIDALLQAGALSHFVLLAVTRDVSSPSASALNGRGLELVQGDLNNVPAIFSAAEKVLRPSQVELWGVYSVQNPIGKGASTALEEAQGKALVDGALANGVKCFVYSSVDRGGEAVSFENKPNVPHFISKYHVEHHLVKEAEGRMQWTILRSATFMDTITPDFIGKIMATSWSSVVKDRPLQIVAVRDIGWFAAQSFLHPDTFAGRAISLAGDALTFDQANQIFKNKVGKDLPTTLEFLNKGILWASTELGSMFQWFNETGCGADINRLKQMHPNMMDFGMWLEESPWMQQSNTSL
ncbi:hypothetical protein PFICI_05121 [Pestalotiopsis fici W106-1]|uniref:NmrA-like domain-containing protein n=1 Tax=Pestalotiopsis fici (strain W106-1 / CGMCC3.15140) TaxID=1229662 RepID=W3XB37_PESFW|nr:uncharacterized protein PFICI_05121 [Pestalotiopsis fici W106-1]ETS83245.1 hypothetical protein PFICI_05121 [Pestalotiopsis fici W106-1]